MYATVQDCVERLGEDAVHVLADISGGDPPAFSALEKALADASAEIDAYIGARHELPLDPVPELLRRLCVEIGVYRRAGDADLASEQQGRRYTDAVHLLKDIAAGRASLGIADPDPPAPAAGPAVRMDSSPRVFDRGATRRML